jgi:hypothetical protein
VDNFIGEKGTSQIGDWWTITFWLDKGQRTLIGVHRFAGRPIARIAGIPALGRMGGIAQMSRQLGLKGSLYHSFG